MRQIKAEVLDTDQWKEWRVDCQAETTANIERHRNSEKIKITSLYKRKYIKDNYFFTDKKPFHGKCVYCETPMNDIFPGDVEHYRPKGKVTDENYDLVYMQNDDGSFVSDENGENKPHPGYFWLAYEWTNLMPSCTYCNRPKKK